MALGAARRTHSIVDDYNDIPACRQAVLDYRKTHGITGEIIRVDWTGVYWKKQN